MKISKKSAMPALGALCLSVVVSLNPHLGGTHLPSEARTGQHASVTAAPGDPGWDGTADPGDGDPDPGWD
ncbi:hypothetical protein [Catenulispora sp. GP43]|uniref:hypothetical protein n=1 Tax=Catenulispora sp. GP43 TaxID=3156263 RepID=UPI0035191B87